MRMTFPTLTLSNLNGSRKPANTPVLLATVPLVGAAASALACTWLQRRWNSILLVYCGHSMLDQPRMTMARILMLICKFPQKCTSVCVANGLAWSPASHTRTGSTRAPCHFPARSRPDHLATSMSLRQSIRELWRNSGLTLPLPARSCRSARLGPSSAALVTKT